MKVMCDRDKCENPAAFQITGKMWAKGYPKDHRCIKFQMGLRVCHEHAHAVTLAEFWTEENKGIIRAAVARAGFAEPDFDGAELVLERLPWVPKTEGRVN